MEIIIYVLMYLRAFKNLKVMVFEERGKLEFPKKSLSEQGQESIQPTHDDGSGNGTRATLVGGECHHHCATLANLSLNSFLFLFSSEKTIKNRTIRFVITDWETYNHISHALIH